ncbi:MAG: L-threonylcarbamoyladenylate synthase [Maribacter sp.]|jgi:L-threonylcarbamoyladenylate synthase
MQTGTKTNKCKSNDFSMLDVDSQDKLLKVLAESGLILFPTDTIWGIGCDATDPNAVDKVYELKRRDKNKPLVILVDGMDMLRRYVQRVHPKIETLLEYHHRPLTVIYEQGINLAPNLLAENGSIGVRIVLDPFCKEMIQRFGKPVVATSANISGIPFPRNYGEISSDILEGVDYVAKVKQIDRDLLSPSIIVKLDKDGELVFVRS